MRCATCGRELGSEERDCPGCRENGQSVKILTPEERENFGGVTLEDDSRGPRGQEYYRFDGEDQRQRVYVRKINFGSGMGLWTKLLFAAVMGFLIFFVLPMAFFLMVAGGLVWLFFRLLRR